MIRNVAAAAVATIQDYPSIAGGICAFAVAFALVAGNAVYGQPGGHPGPIWATRDRVTTDSVGPRSDLVRPDSVIVHRVRTETVVPMQIPVPSIRPETAGQVAATAAAAPAEAAKDDPVRAAQQGLVRLGFYSGDVDGLYGPKTRAAIVAFQKAKGLDADGEVTAVLLDAIAGRQPAGPRPSSQVAERRTDRIGEIAAVAMEEEPERVRAQPASLRLTAPSLRQSTAEVTRAARVARIQIGLMNFGESGLSVDGVMGPRTVEAIRAFQRRYDLPVTGEPDDAVIGKLEQIGALKKG